MHKQNVDSNRYIRYTTEDPLPIFKVEAKHICKSYNDGHSISENTLNDFIKWQYYMVNM